VVAAALTLRVQDEDDVAAIVGNVGESR